MYEETSPTKNHLGLACFGIIENHCEVPKGLGATCGKWQDLGGEFV